MNGNPNSQWSPASARSFARQFSCPSERAGQMPKYGANHLNDLGKMFAGFYQLVSPAEIASKEADLNRINVAVKNVLDGYIFHGRPVDRQIEVPCKINRENKIMVLQRMKPNDKNGGVEVFLKEECSQSYPLDNIRNFQNLFLRIKNELGTDEFSSESYGPFTEFIDPGFDEGDESAILDKTDKSSNKPPKVCSPRDVSDLSTSSSKSFSSSF
jgi:hypothetical protein